MASNVGQVWAGCVAGPHPNRYAPEGNEQLAPRQTADCGGCNPAGKRRAVVEQSGELG